MKDYVKAYLKRKYGGYAGYRTSSPDRRESLQYLDRVKALAARFSDMVVCLDCNEVEGKIKTRIRADKFFTFHAFEIRRAYIPSPNQRHVFLEEHMDFYSRFYAANVDRLVAQRKQIIERLVDQAASEGIFWGNYTEPEHHFSAHELNVVFPTFDSGARIAAGLRNGEAVLQGALWIPEQDEQLRSLSQDGLSTDEIARSMGRTPAAIRFRLDHLGIGGGRNPAGSGCT
jgi:hypothetical protein